MSDNASWFYGERLPEIAREHNCSLKEAERIFRDEKDMSTPEETKYEEVEIELEKEVLHNLMLYRFHEPSTSICLNLALLFQLLYFLL